MWAGPLWVWVPLHTALSVLRIGWVSSKLLSARVSSLCMLWNMGFFCMQSRKREDRHQSATITYFQYKQDCVIELHTPETSPFCNQDDISEMPVWAAHDNFSIISIYVLLWLWKCFKTGLWCVQFYKVILHFCNCVYIYIQTC